MKLGRPAPRSIGATRAREREGKVPPSDGDTKGAVKGVNPGVEPDDATPPIDAPTTAVIAEPPPVEPGSIGANEAPVKEPEPKPKPEKPPLLEVNPGPDI